MSVDIRPLREDELAQLIAALGQPRFFREHFQRQAMGDGVILVAWDSDGPIGDAFVLYPPVEEQPVRDKLPGVPMLIHLEVRPGRQNQGVGSAIIAAAGEHCADKGFDSLALAVGTDNPKAQRLYERLGYYDWNGGQITIGWNHPLPGGSVQPVTLPCNVLIRPIAPGVPVVSAWRPLPPADLPALFGDCPVPWMVAGGWAIDLFTAGPAREHEDTEVAVPRRLFPAARPYLAANHRLFWARYGRMLPLGPHEEPEPPWHQVWLTDSAAEAWLLDVFLEDGDDRVWVSHRDARIRLPFGVARRQTEDGIPYLAPEAVLFGKAKRAEARDERDFAAAVGMMGEPARAWLRDALMTAYPEHHWIAALR
jgi:GNAT superfamily N-acetyltransferase